MNCEIIHIRAKCNDMFSMDDYVGYVPYDLGIGGGDYIEFSFCKRCGLIQGDKKCLEK